MKKSVRKGFTLVELLIVIVVIGILSAMMMLSSTEAVSSARAADIVSDLRNLKTAALAYYADNLVDTGLTAENVKKYLGTVSIDTTKYGFETAESNTLWFVYAEVSDASVKGKLASRAKSVGLLSAATSKDTFGDSDYYSSGAKAYYRIR